MGALCSCHVGAWCLILWEQAETCLDESREEMSWPEAHGGPSFGNQRSNGIRSKMDTVGRFAKIDSRELATLELLQRS